MGENHTKQRRQKAQLGILQQEKEETKEVTSSLQPGESTATSIIRKTPRQGSYIWRMRCAVIVSNSDGDIYPTTHTLMLWRLPLTNSQKNFTIYDNPSSGFTCDNCHQRNVWQTMETPQWGLNKYWCRYSSESQKHERDRTGCSTGYTGYSMNRYVCRYG